jgi:putative NIF3 family GTP cyclohydrolase 1 type 2
MDFSRRSFLAAGASLVAADALLSARARATTATLTAADVIQRIKNHVGIPWRAETVDNVIAGDPQTTVKGIATTMMATLEVVQRAAAAGRNLVITHEPTFYSHQDKTEALGDDPAYRFKQTFVREHDMVVFHFHDHWHARRPDGIATGMARELGWESHADAEHPREFVFPGTPLGELARDMEARLKIRTMRVVGDPALPVRRVATSWGYYTFAPPNLPLARPEIDVFVVGETREWETVEHAQDLIAAGKPKGLIILGHVVSEQAGMKYCAEWLQTFVPEVPIEFVPAPEPFWRPGQPAR